MNANIRKRRAFCHDEAPAEPVLHVPIFSSPAALDALPYPADHRYILDQGPLPYVPPLSGLMDPTCQDYQQLVVEQTALTFNQQPLGSDLDLDSQHYPYISNQQCQDVDEHLHFHKKPRLNASVQMPRPYSDDIFAQDGQEKAAHSGPSGPEMSSRHKPYVPFTGSGISGWTSTRLSDCFASISMCPPFESQPTYRAPPTPASHDYDDHRSPALDTAVATVQRQVQASLLATPISPDATALFPCDDPAMMAPYLPNYPPLQPAPATDFQPATGREEMVYPNVSAATSSPHGASSLGMQPSAYLVDPPLQSGPTGGPYASGESPIHGMLANLASRFHLMQRFSTRAGAENVLAQVETPVVDLVPSHKTTPVKRGPFKDQDSREKTALTRKMGSCIRCRMQRIRCNLDPENEKGPCLSCKKIASGAKVYRLNCLRLKITDVKLFKPGQVKGQEWTNRWKDGVMDDIGTWESSQVRTIQVTEGYTGKSVRLQVREFRPQQGDKVERSWVSKNGRAKSVRIPTYAIVNLDEAKAAFDQYIKVGLVECCHHLLGSRDKLLWRTYSLAIKTAKDPSTPPSERSLLVATLDLWMSVRLTTKSFEIVGDETLGMPRDIINDPDNPLHGKIPLPPVMGAQIDSVIIHQIQPRLRRKALEELQKITQEKKQKTWLTTYLVTFILLHNIALITKHDAEYAKKHGLGRRFAREANVKEYNLGANTLLAYFHYCNKAIYPFSAECRDQDLQTLAELNDEAVSFVHFTRRIVAAQRKEWESLWHRDDYENEYYYVSQLFEHNWQPRTMA